MFIFLCAASCLSLFALMGNTHEPARYGPSVISWLVNQWMDPGSKSSHGWMIPLVSMFAVWRKRKAFINSIQTIDNRALAIVVVCLVLHWAGCRAQQPRLGIIALVGLAWSIPFYLWGSATARLLVFPCSYLLFAMPMGFLAALAFPLRLFSCTIAASLLNGIGIETVRTGTIIVSPCMQGFSLNVDDPCSGLQSIIAMSALTAAYAYFTQKSLLKQWALFLSAFPFAIISNVIRIITIAIVAAVSGHEAAMKIYHDYSGFIVFASAILLMTALGTALDRNFRRQKQSCKNTE